MEKQDPKEGCINNISSVHQTIPKPHYIPYATSRAGVEMMTKTMALECQMQYKSKFKIARVFCCNLLYFLKTNTVCFIY